MQDISLRTTLYRYFFFGWLFKDVGSGTLFERAAAVRYNREQARWLPTYVLRYLWCALVFYTLGGASELLLEAPRLATVFYALSALAMSFNVTIAVAWLGLRSQHHWTQ